jgi:mercuric ion binding protein
MKSLGLFAILLMFAGSAMAKASTSEIKVSGMTCGACAVSVKKSLEKTKGVKAADVSVEKGQATVVYDDSQVNEQQLRDAINKTGFKAEPVKEKK